MYVNAFDMSTAGFMHRFIWQCVQMIP